MYHMMQMKLFLISSLNMLLFMSIYMLTMIIYIQQKDLIIGHLNLSINKIFIQYLNIIY